MQEGEVGMKAHRMNTPASRPARGFTILEVVVAMIIISILTLILMPTVSNRANQARLASAEADMQTLAEAESRASIDMGYYIVPWRLNNVIASQESDARNTRNDNQTTLGYTRYDDMFVNIVTQDIPGNVNELYADFILDETAFGWRGPYVNFRRDDDENNWPDDPWGNEYLLFTTQGALFPPEAPGVNDSEFVTTGPAFTQLDGTANGGIATLDQLFDRPTWISLGPNELPGDGEGSTYGTGDDIAVRFEGIEGSST